ncbi:ATP-dependent protease, partial [Amylibacter sp.]|nr:ATP-dependent protease [Amylibacter sp.]
MYKLNSLPETISLFPLGNALLLPHSRLPLNIFEPRYLSLLDDTMKSDHRL